MTKFLSIALLFAASAFGQFTNATKIRGSSICSPFTPLTDTFVLTYNATTRCWGPTAGAAGPTGPTGPTGATGATGAAGPVGNASQGNITPVTVNGNVTSDQALQEIALPAGYLNTLKQQTIFNSSGIFTIAVAQTPTLTFKLKLCTVSGCGSGTVVTLVSIATAATVAATNNPWNMTLSTGTSAVGASGTLIVHGFAAVDIGALATAAETVYNDGNTAVSSTIDLTAALFADWTVTTSSGNAGNTFTQQNAGVMTPGGSAVTSVFGQVGAVPNLSGDVTTSGSSAATIAALAVTNAKIANATIDLTAKVTGVLPAANIAAALSSSTSVNGTSIPSSVTLTQTIASGTSALGTSAIASAACATVVTTTATGTASTDAITWIPNGSIKAVTGYVPLTAGGLSITGYPTTNAVNWDVCNWTTSSITPGAVTLNWRVTR